MIRLDQPPAEVNRLSHRKQLLSNKSETEPFPGTMRKRVVPATEWGQAQYAGPLPRPPKQPKPGADPDPAPSAPDAAGVVQLKVWLLRISPMIWRRLLVPNTCTLRELHGVIQVAMGEALAYVRVLRLQRESMRTRKAPRRQGQAGHMFKVG